MSRLHSHHYKITLINAINWRKHVAGWLVLFNSNQGPSRGGHILQYVEIDLQINENLGIVNDNNEDVDAQT